MVEAGELTIVGKIEDEGLSAGFQRFQNDFNELQNQANQTNASMSILGKTSFTLMGTLLAIGTAGLSAITSLASKSPVLAGTMAKMEMETLKLSNTLGRQLRPMFEAIADDLIPSINSAFSKNSEFMGDMADNATLFVQAISDLIELDWTGLLGNLDKLFLSKPIDQQEGEVDPFAESKQSAKDLAAIYDPANKQYIEEHPTGAALAVVGNVLNLAFHGVIDTLQWIVSTKDEKEKAFAMADGVPR